MPLITVDGITVNVGPDPLNYEGLEDEMGDLIAKLEVVFREDDHAQLLERAISMKRKGALFPSDFFLVTARGRPSYRPPSDEAMDMIPGHRELLNEVVSHWPKLRVDKNSHAFFKRIIMSLFLSADVSDILDITPNVFASQVRPWKDELGFWRKELFGKDPRKFVTNKVADAFGRLNKTDTYKLATKQPRTQKDGLVRVGAIVKMKNPTEDIKRWVDLFDKWLHGLVLSNTSLPERAFWYFLGWIACYPVELRSSPEVFLAVTRKTPSFVDFLMKEGADELGKEEKKCLGKMVEFTEWVRREVLVSQDEDGTVVLGQPILLPNQEASFRGAYLQGPSSTTSVPLPTAWRIRLRDIISRDDFAFPKSFSNQWCEWRSESGILEKVWNPVLAYAFLLMLEIPLRMHQVIALDSGEGDEKKYDPVARKWIDNEHPAAGWWVRNPDAKKVKRGVLQPMGSQTSPIVGLNINTNKTSGNSERYGERAGYAIPWQNERVIELVSALRKWQEKYNPVKEPLPFSAVAKPVFGYSPTRRAEAKAPDVFYLFRSPNSPSNRMAPPASGQRRDFWLALMDQLEKELREDGEDVQVIAVRKADGNPQRSAYNIHGLRVATLTAFAEAGVPIEILSKLVAGHSTILMTLYYIHFKEAAISDLLTEKALQVEANAEGSLKEHLAQASWEDAKRLAVYNDENTFRRVVQDEMYPYWHNVGYGFCPYGGGKCSEGGPPSNDVMHEKDRRYHPVPGGSQNCVRCRFLVTGTPFLLRMWLKTNKCLADAKKVALEYDAHEKELEKLLAERHRLKAAGRKDEIKASILVRIRELEATCEMKSDKLNENLLDLHAAWRLLEGIKEKIQDKDSENSENLPVLLTAGEVKVDPQFRDGTRFELTSYLLKASRVAPFLRDEDMERERQQFLDTLLLRENLMPLCLMPLDAETKRRAADAASMWLLNTVGAREVEMLHSGEVSLKALGYRGEEMFTTIEAQIGMPLPMGRPAPLAIGGDNSHG